MKTKWNTTSVIGQISSIYGCSFIKSHQIPLNHHNFAGKFHRVASAAPAATPDLWCPSAACANASLGELGGVAEPQGETLRERAIEMLGQWK